MNAVVTPEGRDPPSDDLPKLDKYELSSEIGHGGMATVYRASDKRLGREVAIKIIHRHLRDNPEVATRFLAEARAAAKLKHEGIVEVYDVSPDDDREKYLVVELIKGTTLRKTLLAHREMPPEVGACIVAKLCDAVEHAQEKGIVHRDIKPENVLVELPSDRARPSQNGSEPSDEMEDSAPRVKAGLDEDRTSDRTSDEPAGSDPDSKRRKKAKGAPRSGPGQSGRGENRVVIKLTDFGIAKVMDAQSVTSTGQVLGSPAHMAPEQIEGGEVDIRTDVFALGVLLYECMVGHLPFEGKNPAQVLRRVIDGQYSPADVERPIVGSRFASIVATALATDVEDRTASPSALGQELRSELSALGIEDIDCEIGRYFEDPAGYTAAHTSALVPKLIARGEAAKKSKNIPLAAADFNRAHALAPGDSTILRRMTQLSSARSRGRLATRLGFLAGLAIVLSGSTYGIVKLTRFPRLNPTENQAASQDIVADSPRRPPPLHPNVLGPDEVSVGVIPSIRRTAASVRPADSAQPAGPIATTAPSSKEPAATGTRKVRIAASPGGALLEMGGSPVQYFGQEIELGVGAHPYVLSPPPGETCCDKSEGSMIVVAAPADKPNEVQRIPVSLKPKPASVRLVGAPPGGTAVCGPYSVPANGSQEVNLSSAEWTGPCHFTSGQSSISHTVTLHAGSSNSIPWPPG